MDVRLFMSLYVLLNMHVHALAYLYTPSIDYLADSKKDKDSGISEAERERNKIMNEFYSIEMEDMSRIEDDDDVEAKSPKKKKKKTSPKKKSPKKKKKKKSPKKKNSPPSSAEVSNAIKVLAGWTCVVFIIIYFSSIYYDWIIHLLWC